MVTPECCLEKVAAERHRSVVPQRYAVLCASYLSAVRRRPSVSGVFDVRDDEVPSQLWQEVGPGHYCGQWAQRETKGGREHG